MYRLPPFGIFAVSDGREGMEYAWFNNRQTGHWLSKNGRSGWWQGVGVML